MATACFEIRPLKNAGRFFVSWISPSLGGVGSWACPALQSAHQGFPSSRIPGRIPAMHAAPPPAAIREIERPAPRLLSYYLLNSLLAGPAFPLVFIPLYCKFHTLRYRFDDEGISLRWGILFRREIVLNYARIQDIHLSSNPVERWLRLAKIEIQTASGSARAEMVIEGIMEFEPVRDFLYSRMRGTQDATRTVSASCSPDGALPAGEQAQLVKTLEAVAEQLRAVRFAFERKQRGGN